MTTTTKAQLETSLAELTRQLDEANARIAELETASRPHLQQAVWLPRGTTAELREAGTLRCGVTRKGDTWVSLQRVQYAAVDQQGARRYGAPKTLSAFGAPADDLLSLLDGDTRLVAIKAYEDPSPAREGDNRRYSDWKIVEIQAIGRSTEAPAAPPVAAGYGEPSEEEVPF